MTTHEKLDFRSDTITLPTDEMRAAMAVAPVGDDVYKEDPTVNRLQQISAEITGMEAACWSHPERWATLLHYWPIASAARRSSSAKRPTFFSMKPPARPLWAVSISRRSLTNQMAP